MYKFIFLLFASVAYANFNIIAVVGDRPITQDDFDSRLNLAMISAGISGDDIKEKIIPQIKKIYIDEILYQKAASDLNIELQESKFNYALAQISKKYNLKVKDLYDFFANKGVKATILESQIKSQLLWQEVLLKAVKPKVFVSEKDIDEMMEAVSSEKGRLEYNLSYIVIENVKGDKHSKKLAQELYEQIQEGGQFDNIREEFSIIKEENWYDYNSLDESLIAQIKDKSINSIIEPVKIGKDYYITRINNNRIIIDAEIEESEVGLKQAFIPYGSLEENKASVKNLQKLKAIKSCSAFDKAAIKIGSRVSPDKIMMQLKDLAKNIKEEVIKLNVNNASNVVNSQTGYHVFFLCEKIDAIPSLAQREKFKDLIFRNKLALEAKKYLTNLRNDTYVSVEF